MHKAFWPEIFRIWMQWLGVGLAAIPSGILLGILERAGVTNKAALSIALVSGFIIALALWLLMGRMFAVRSIEYPASLVSSNVISLQPDTAQSAQGAQIFTIAAMVLFVSLPVQRPEPLASVGASHISYAIPKL